MSDDKPQWVCEYEVDLTTTPPSRVVVEMGENWGGEMKVTAEYDTGAAEPYRVVARCRSVTIGRTAVVFDPDGHGTTMKLG